MYCYKRMVLNGNWCVHERCEIFMKGLHRRRSRTTSPAHQQELNSTQYTQFALANTLFSTNYLFLASCTKLRSCPIIPSSQVSVKQ